MSCLWRFVYRGTKAHILSQRCKVSFTHVIHTRCNIHISLSSSYDCHTIHWLHPRHEFAARPSLYSVHLLCLAAAGSVPLGSNAVDNNLYKHVQCLVCTVKFCTHFALTKCLLLCRIQLWHWPGCSDTINCWHHWSACQSIQNHFVSRRCASSPCWSSLLSSLSVFTLPFWWEQSNSSTLSISIISPNRFVYSLLAWRWAESSSMPPSFMRSGLSWTDMNNAGWVHCRSQCSNPPAVHRPSSFVSVCVCLFFA